MFPDRSVEIQFHREAARKFRGQGDYAQARASYMKWVESVRQQNIRKGGGLESDLAEAKSEYSDFVKSDPLYLKIREAALEKIQEEPAILQTELYKALHQFDRGDISYAMYFAEDHRFVTRVKKGRTYSLNVE